MTANPAADVRQMIEDVCDAARLADKLEQALTALEAADSLADVVREIHERATINSYVRWRLRASEERYRAAARDARGGWR